MAELPGGKRLLDTADRRVRSLTAGIGLRELRAILRGDPRWLFAALLSGYAFAWIGHFFFEKNRPATFKHPFYSFAGDWVMYRDILVGRIPF